MNIFVFKKKQISRGRDQHDKIEMFSEIKYQHITRI